MNKNVNEITEGLKAVMDKYNWPGNIRELEHFIENIMVRTSDNERYLKEDNIPKYISDLIQRENKDINLEWNISNNLQEELDKLERKTILDTLNSNMWNVSKSAKQLGITRQSMIYRMKKLEIERKQ